VQPGRDVDARRRVDAVEDVAGAGTLTVTEVGSRTAADLRLLGTGVVGGSGQQEIVSRNALIVDVAATDTLTGVAAKINSVGGTVRASVINSGAALNGFRLTLSSTLSGQAGRFVVDNGNLNLGFSTQETGQDAVLRVGSDPATGFLLNSSGNTFTNAPGNFDITLLAVGTTAANVSAARDNNKIAAAIESFVAAYNNYVDLSIGLTKYDTSTQTRSALQGTSTPLLIQARFNTLVNRVTGGDESTVRSLADAGVKLTTGGKLSFDSEKLTDALTRDPDAVRDLFTSTTNGFARDFDAALDYFNDDIDGTLTAQNESLQKTADSLTARIADIDRQLDGRRARLELQFAQMETILSGLQSQQQSLTGLSTILSNLKYNNSN
ncbi:MAG: flagellar filament capping protein FliD, partial [Planctomycetaceae bacterium]|nr:flagellar filament capping protein FliD [Planctomycetaceae bacterium]